MVDSLIVWNDSVLVFRVIDNRNGSNDMIDAIGPPMWNCNATIKTCGHGFFPCKDSFFHPFWVEKILRKFGCKNVDQLFDGLFL